MAPRVRKGRHAGLTRELVLEAALTIVDTEGLEALTMRRLGRALGVEAMSVYNHVKDKPALLSGVLDLAAQGFEPPEAPGLDWKAWVKSWMWSARSLFLAHPQLFHVLLGNPELGPNVLRMIDSLFGRMSAAGFSPAEQVRAWEVLKSFLFGHLVQQGLPRSTLAPKDLQECCPHLAQTLPLYACCDFDAMFNDGEDAILEGLGHSPA